MKKLFIILMLVLVVCGCSNSSKKGTFKHYDLKDKDLNPYSYIYEDGSSDLYVLADMTGKDSLAVMTGLFYKVGEDDYILLDTFESSQTEAYVKNSIYSFAVLLQENFSNIFFARTSKVE